MKTFKSHPFISLILGFFLLLILVSNVKGVLFNCFHAYDFGIYQQGIYNLAAGESLNPYLSVRGVNTFNDHFMPVLFLAVPFVWIFQYHPTSLIFFEWLWFFLFLFVVFKELRKREFSSPLILYSLGLIIFSKGFLTALEFPIHPGTWSMPLWFLLIVNIQKDKCKKIMFFAISLCLFREAYPFGIFLLGLYFLVKRKHPITGLVLTCFSFLYASFVFILRPRLMGETASYGGRLLKGFVESPVEAFTKLFMAFDPLVVLKIFLPALLLLIFIFYKEKKEIKILSDWRVPAFLTVIPLYAIHFLTNKYHFHYGPAFIAPLLSIAFLSKSYTKILDNKKIATLIMLTFIATASGRYTKFFNNLFLSKNNKCRFDEQYSLETKSVVLLVEKLSRNAKILASGGVIQRVMRPGIEIYPPDTMVELPAQFDAILFLRNGAGDTYPWTKEKVEKAIKNCSNYSSEVLLNSNFYYFAKGQFPATCISH